MNVNKTMEAVTWKMESVPILMEATNALVMMDSDFFMMGTHVEVS